MEQQTPRSSDFRPGLVSGAVNLAKNMFGLFMSRIELAALELAEVRANALKLVALFVLGAIVAWFAIAYWSALIVYLSWPVLGWKILLILAIVFTAVAVGILLYVQSLLREGKLSMPATMAELRNDHDALL
ncbi:MAG: phage holin family protein [Burkholderiaceae bacterium]|uniref:phage holin family protein n=1 Tax=Herminiimonas sp. Marseille-P9896 TaxID=2742211 RepID=UPI00158BBF24|nr:MULTISPECIES: phage holin family protein [Oxalobacteraceae]MBX9799186.1 phage holin family protein [Burkholderiaceae bacterium]